MTMLRAYDLGGSGLRTMEIGGKGRITKLPSKFKNIEVSSPIRKDVEVPMDDFIINKAPWLPIVGKRFLKQGAFSMHKGAIEGTDNQALKSKQDGTYVNAIYAIATDLLKRKIMKEDDIKLGVCIPSGEYYSTVGAESIKDGLEGRYQVTFPVLNKVVEFKIRRKDISVSPEGVVALYVFFKTKYGEKIKNGNTLVLDGGFRSFDITILKNFSAEGGSSRSFPMGGITLEALVANELERAGIFASNEDAVMAIETGFINEGQGKKAVGKWVQEAKRILARRVYDAAIQVMNTSGLFIQNINFVVPIGRCFTDVGVKTDAHYTGSLTEFFMDFWKADAQVLEVPNLEEANIKGLAMSMRAKYGNLVAAQEEELRAAEEVAASGEVTDTER